MNTFPFDNWQEASEAAGDTGFFTFGGTSDAGAIVLVVLMIAVTVITIIAGVIVEGRKLDAQAERLRSAARGEG